MIAILSAGIAPIVALMSFIYLKDRITEPLPIIVRTFISGTLLVFPIMFIQYAITTEHVSDSSFIESFFQIALFEEFFKWFIFMFLIYNHPEFDNHYDGIVYAVSISLGFASVENILYLLTNGIEYAFLRAFFPVSSHALFGIIMGFYLGKAKMSKQNRKLNIALAFLFPFMLHGTYNFILKSYSQTSSWFYLLIPFMIVLWIVALQRMKAANDSYLNSYENDKETFLL
ncbi:glutamic-type intramembrane protease PrsW [Oceanobacillus massiliensis]|uniref:glutamic-type intramembrane protease PrsW n=1 Tax=Oceanobacillus massiliensis TaxID=1465765 RepID=UPI0002883539|nr:glutamic-type intramembrane protease PrsW [Oceanobacillus massiliensis]